MSEPTQKPWLKQLLEECHTSSGDIDEAMEVWDAAGDDDFSLLSLLIARIDALTNLLNQCIELHPDLPVELVVIRADECSRMEEHNG